MLNPPVNGKIQGLLKVFECFSSTFQGKFNFPGLFKTTLYIQVLFKPVRTLHTIFIKTPTLGKAKHVTKFKMLNAVVHSMDGLAGNFVSEPLFKVGTFFRPIWFQMFQNK